MKKEIVKYDYELTKTLDVQKLTATDLNVLMALLSKAKKNPTEKHEISFDEIRKIADLSVHSHPADNFDEFLYKSVTKLTRAFILEEDDKIVWMPIFSKVVALKKEQKLFYRVNPDLAESVGDKSNPYVTFPLIDYVALKGKYTKRIYEYLMKFRTTGKVFIPIDELKKTILNIPDSYNIAKIAERYLYPMLDEIRELNLIPNLSFELRPREKMVRFIFTPFDSSSEIYNYIPLVDNEALGQSWDEEKQEPEEELDFDNLPF